MLPIRPKTWQTPLLVPLKNGIKRGKLAKEMHSWEGSKHALSVTILTHILGKA